MNQLNAQTISMVLSNRTVLQALIDLAPGKFGITRNDVIKQINRGRVTDLQLDVIVLHLRQPRQQLLATYETFQAALKEAQRIYFKKNNENNLN